MILLGFSKAGFAKLWPITAPLLAPVLSPIQATDTVLPMLILQDALTVTCRPT